MRAAKVSRLGMTEQETILWDYIDEESNDLLLEIAKRVKDDGFSAAVEAPIAMHDAAEELLGLKIVSQTMVKQLALLAEKIDHPDLVQAYMTIVPLHVGMIKYLMMIQARQEAS